MTGEKAVLVDSGSFRVDRKRALDKLMNFQLPDARMYPLAWVQAAVAGGATDISIRTEEAFVMGFDGQPFTPEELKEPYASLFQRGSGDRQARNRNLAIGLLSVLRLTPRLVTVTSTSGGVRHVLRVRTVTEDEFVSEPAPGDPDGTVIRVERPRPLIPRFLGGPGMDEAAYLRDRCRHCSTPIRMDAEPLQAEAGIEEAVSFDEDGVSGTLRLASWPASRIDLVTHGVTVCTEAPVLPLVQVEGFVRDDRFRKNISQMSVVKDERYRKALSAAASHSRALLLRALEETRALASAVGAAIAGDSYCRRRWIPQESPALLGQALGLFQKSEGILKKAEAVIRMSYTVEALRQACLRNLPELAKAERGAFAELWRAPLLFDVSGKPLSLAALDEQRRVLGHVPYSARWSPSPVRNGLAAWTPRAADKEFLDAVFPGQVLPVLTGWSEDRIDLSSILGRSDKTLVRMAVEGQGAEMALCSTFRAEESRIRWLLNGREPAVTSVETGSLRLDIVADRPGLSEPPAPDSPETAQLVKAALQRAPELYWELFKELRPREDTVPQAAAYYDLPKELPPQEAPGPRQAAVLEHLLDFATEAWSGGKLPPREANDWLQRAPLFRLSQGGTVSLDDVRSFRERGEQVALLSCSQHEDLRYLVRDRPGRVGEIFEGSGLGVDIQKVDLSKARARKAPQEEKAVPAAAVPLKAAVSAPGPAPGVSAEEWIDALQGRFQELAAENTLPQELLDLQSLELAERGSSSGWAAWRSRGGGSWTINPAHPMVRTALSAPDLASGLPYLASIVLSTANRLRPEVSDEQDVLLQMSLVRGAGKA